VPTPALLKLRKGERVVLPGGAGSKILGGSALGENLDDLQRARERVATILARGRNAKKDDSWPKAQKSK